MLNSKHRERAHHTLGWTGHDLLNQDPIQEEHSYEPPGIAMGCALALGVLGLLLLGFAGVIYLTIGMIN